MVAWLKSLQDDFAAVAFAEANEPHAAIALTSDRRGSSWPPPTGRPWSAEGHHLPNLGPIWSEPNDRAGLHSFAVVSSTA